MCLVIELMDTSLERLLYGGGPAGGPRPPMPLSKVLHVAIQVCEALAYLHPTIIHRDLKVSGPPRGLPALPPALAFPACFPVCASAAGSASSLPHPIPAHRHAVCPKPATARQRAYLKA